MLIYGLLLSNLLMGNSEIKRITLIPFEPFGDKVVLVFLKDELEKRFKIPVAYENPIPLDRYAFQKRRNQYYSPILLQELRNKPKDKSIILGIVDVDLYVNGLNFIFGQANLRDGVAIISLTRLREEYYGHKPDETLFRKRVTTEAVHELGHIYGLNHCSNPKCVMFFSNSLADTDSKGPDFCEICSRATLSA